MAIQRVETVTDEDGVAHEVEHLEWMLAFDEDSAARWEESLKSGNSLAREFRDSARESASQHRTMLALPRTASYRFRGKRFFTEVSEEEYLAHSEMQKDSPILLVVRGSQRWWWYRDRFWSETEGLEAEDVQALVLKREQRKQAKLKRLRAEMLGDRPAEDASETRREPIPESVRHEVWRRDQGRCVQCGSRENLEFDHIIPVSKGGANTARNLQLLCESCNRSKGATI